MTEQTSTTTASLRAEADPDEAYLVVDDLTVTFPTEDGALTAVSGLTYSVELGQTLGIVGDRKSVV